MLYVTTRSNSDPQTAHRALTELRAEDGGFFLPLTLPVFSRAEIGALKEKTFGQAVADILNLFFSTHLTGWDVEFCIGRYPVRLVPMSHRIVLTETWHNPDWDFSRNIRELTAQISGGETEKPGEWAVIAVRIAVLFGIFAELMRMEDVSARAPVDISVPSGDFSAAMAAVYGKAMGLPIANIVVCCNENSSAWDLVYKGELRTGSVAARTCLPDCDRILPTGLERFLYACGGTQAVEDYLARARVGGVYFPDEETTARMRQTLQVTVISGKRVLSSIPNIYQTTGKVLGPYTALTWCGLMDYRARVGESRLSLVFSDRSPQSDLEVVASAMGMEPEELNKIL